MKFGKCTMESWKNRLYSGSQLGFLLILFLLSCGIVRAEDRDVQKFEGGIDLGLGIGIGYGGAENLGEAGNISISGRYNIPDSPVDIGVYIGLNNVEHRYRNPDNSFSHRGNQSYNYGISGGYNLKRGHLFNPYAELSLGYCNFEGRGDDKFSEGICIVPRVGIELLHHFRVSALCFFTRNGYNSACICVGIVIGGRPKKKPYLPPPPENPLILE